MKDKLDVLCNLEAETRNGYHISAEMKQVWNIQLNMLVKLVDVCKRHNLKVTLDSGSLLGAIRHKGFIPWDDDIDVDMSRDDYDVLCKVAPAEFTAPYFFQCPYTEKGYYRGHAQVRYDDTAMILPGDARKGFDFHQGIFIDIFPSDGVPDDDAAKSRLASEVSDIYQYLWMRRYPLMRYGNYSYYRQIRKTLGEKSKWGDRKLYEYTEQLFRKNSFHTSTRVFHYSLILNRATRSIKSPEWYDDVIEVPFEGIMAPVPRRYHEILTQVYGDYMAPKQAPSLHGTVIIDTKKSYREYLPKLRDSYIKMYYRFARWVIRGLLRKLKTA